MLSHALAVTHDATVGFWNPVPSTLTTPPAPPTLDTLEYLSGVRRHQVLFGSLIGRFRVTPLSGGKGAALSLDTHEICSIAKPDDTIFKEQLVWLRNYADLRPDRISEIVLQTGDLLSFYGSAVFLNDSRRKKTLELLALVQAVAITVEMQIKHHCWSPRPIDFAPQVQPIIQTPDHSSFPSGHATEAYALATVLERLQGKQSAQAGIDARAMSYRIAHRIAVNRTVAGVHFPVDSAAGAVLGCMIAEAVHSVAMGLAPQKLSYGADGIALGGTEDFVQKWLVDSFRPAALSEAVASDPMLATFWHAAAAEWS